MAVEEIGLIKGMVGLGALAFLFYILLGVGFLATFLSGIPSWLLGIGILIGIVWLLKK